jgi:glycosyltransferase involved in cell wall biosynthesis
MSLYPGITAVVAAHPARLANGLLVRSLASICRQTLQPNAILVVNDTDKLGAGHTRQRILEQINTEWFAWLDSDDYWFPHHLAELDQVRRLTGAKYVYSWFQANHDPLGHFGKTFDVCNPHHTTITALVNTEIAKTIGYPPSSTEGQFSDEDWSFISRFAAYCCEHGERMIHVPQKTWYWEQSGQNTSGRPDRGDAK